jgi:hypothetical protein
MYDNYMAEYFKKNNLEVLYEFKILYCGWECDEDGWVVKNKTTKKCSIIRTNHGTPYIADTHELENKIEEYQRCINSTQLALSFVI